MIWRILEFLFPNAWMFAFALGWVAVATFGSLLSNHQDRRNKLLNTIKTLVMVTFLVSWTMLAGWINSGKISPTGAVIGYIGASLYIAGDWIAYFIDKTVRSPGGVRGAFWMWVLGHVDKFRLRVVEEARESLHPAERRFMELEILERNTLVVSAPAPMNVSLQPATAPPVAAPSASAPPVATPPSSDVVTGKEES